MRDGVGGEEPGSRQIRLLAGVGIALAAVFSLLRKGYQFDGYYADDQFWNTLLVHRIHPELLANDPLVVLIADRYKSGLFDLIAALAPAFELPGISFALFLAARLLACIAMYRLALTLTRSVPAALVSVFLLAGASISYLGGINFVETILTPRGLAFSLGLFGLDAFLRRQPVAMTLWLAACLYVHPVSGVNFLGSVVFCGVLFPDTAPRRPFVAALAVLGAGVLAIGAWTGQLGGEAGPFRIDAAWAEVIAESVGPWVYVALTPSSVWLTALWMPVLGAVAVVQVGSPELRVTFVRFALASVAAVGIHWVAVDVLQIKALLQASPQRATVAFTAIAVVAVGSWIAASLRQRDIARRALGGALLLACVLLRDPSIAVLFALLLACAWWPRFAEASAGWRGAAALIAGTALVASTGPTIAASFHLAPRRVVPRMARVGNLGLDADWVAVQRHIRSRSRVEDAVMAPPALSPRVFAERPSTLRLKMQSFTHVSREFAFEFAAWRREIEVPMRTAGAARAAELARRSGARWLVLDERDVPERVGEPSPDFRAGPYRAFSLEPPVSGDGSPTRERKRGFSGRAD